MEIDDPRRGDRHRVTYFAIMVTFLVLMAASLGTMFYLSGKAAQQAATNEVVQRTAATQAVGTGGASIENEASGPRGLESNAKFLARLAWLSAALMAMTLLVLFWVVIHFILGRARHVAHRQTQYVDAWSLAGQRVQPIDDDEIDEPDEDDEK